MDDTYNSSLRSRSQKLRITFPDGTIICFTSCKKTYVETLKKIGMVKLQTIDLEIGHLPIFSRVIYPKYKDYMEPIADGWYVNTQSDTPQKYLQLSAINNKLGLGLSIEVGNDFVLEKASKTSKKLNILQVTFDDGTEIGEETPLDTFLQCIWHIGIDVIKSKNIEVAGKPFISLFKQYNNQIQIDTNIWAYVPGSTKDKVKLLKVIGAMTTRRMDIFFA